MARLISDVTAVASFDSDSGLGGASHSVMGRDMNEQCIGMVSADLSGGLACASTGKDAMQDRSGSDIQQNNAPPNVEVLSMVDDDEAARVREG